MKILAGIITGLVAMVGGYFMPHQAAQTPVYGSYNPTGGGTYRLGQSIGTSNSTIKLSSFKEPVSNIPYTMSYINTDIIYGTISPQSSISEFISATGITQNADGSATLTGVTRGLSRTPGTGGCVASTTLAQAHAGQSIFILSNAPCQVAEYLPLRTIATSTAATVISSTSPWHYDFTSVQKNGTYISTTSELASIDYVNAVALAGASNATESVKGISELATQREMGSSTILGGTGAGLVLQSKYATDTPNYCSLTLGASGGCIPITNLLGFLNPLFIATTSAAAPKGYTYTASTTFNGTTTIAANDINASPLRLNSINYTFPPTQSASSSVLSTNGSGSLTWNSPKVTTLSVNSTEPTTSSTASTTLVSVTIPANTLTTTSHIKFSVQGYKLTASNSCNFGVFIGNGSASTTIGWVASDYGAIEGTVFATSTSRQTGMATGINSNGTTYYTSGFSSYSNAGQLYMAFTAGAITAATCAILGESVTVLSN